MTEYVFYFPNFNFTFKEVIEKIQYQKKQNITPMNRFGKAFGVYTFFFRKNCPKSLPEKHPKEGLNNKGPGGGGTGGGPGGNGAGIEK